MGFSNKESLKFFIFIKFASAQWDLTVRIVFPLEKVNAICGVNHLFLDISKLNAEIFISFFTA